jgi:hypothetical protein
MRKLFPENFFIVDRPPEEEPEDAFMQLIRRNKEAS